MSNTNVITPVVRYAVTSQTTGYVRMRLIPADPPRPPQNTSAASTGGGTP